MLPGTRPIEFVLGQTYPTAQSSRIDSASVQECVPGNHAPPYLSMAQLTARYKTDSQWERDARVLQDDQVAMQIQKEKLREQKQLESSWEWTASAPTVADSLFPPWLGGILVKLPPSPLINGLAITKCPEYPAYSPEYTTYRSPVSQPSLLDSEVDLISFTEYHPVTPLHSNGWAGRSYASSAVRVHSPLTQEWAYEPRDEQMIGSCSVGSTPRTAVPQAYGEAEQAWGWSPRNNKHSILSRRTDG